VVRGIGRIVLTRRRCEATDEPPPTHWQPATEEQFEVSSGVLTVELGDDPPQKMSAGSTFAVPVRTPQDVEHRSRRRHRYLDHHPGIADGGDIPLHGTGSGGTARRHPPGEVPQRVPTRSSAPVDRSRPVGDPRQIEGREGTWLSRLSLVAQLEGEAG
jgi:hypothetical protein